MSTNTQLFLACKNWVWICWHNENISISSRHFLFILCRTLCCFTYGTDWWNIKKVFLHYVTPCWKHLETEWGYLYPNNSWFRSYNPLCIGIQWQTHFSNTSIIRLHNKCWNSNLMAMCISSITCEEIPSQPWIHRKGLI